MPGEVAGVLPSNATGARTAAKCPVEGIAFAGGDDRLADAELSRPVPDDGEVIVLAEGVKGNKINIHAPLINMTKTEIVAMGLKMGVDYSTTISCYNPNSEGDSCGKCLACLVRIKAFEENGVQDQISYIKD